VLDRAQQVPAEHAERDEVRHDQDEQQDEHYFKT
jgi:hypothetical protein